MGYCEVTINDFIEIAQSQGFDEYSEQIAEQWYSEFRRVTKGDKDLEGRFFLILDDVEYVEEVVDMIEYDEGLNHIVSW